MPAAAEAAWPPAPPYNPPSDAEDENEDFFLRGVCGTCGDDAVDNDMMRCERCGAMHHPACARRTPRRTASAAWECEQCVAGGSTAGRKAVTISDFFLGTAGVMTAALMLSFRGALSGAKLWQAAECDNDARKFLACLASRTLEHEDRDIGQAR